MNVILALPFADPLPLPAPPALLWGLLILTFFLHLLFMNFVLGGSVIAVASRSRSHRSDDAAKLSHWLGKAMPTAVAAAVTFGVAPLLFLQALYGRLFFSSSVLMAWLWLAIVPLLILAYYGAYAIAFRKEAHGPLAMVITSVMAVIFLGIAFVQSNNMSLMLRADALMPMYQQNARGTALNLADTTLLPRYLHMIFGALAVAALVVALYGVFRSRDDEQHGRWAMHTGALWFSGATVLNILTGFWWLTVLPAEVMLRFMGRSTAATAYLAIGIVSGVIALAGMVVAARSETPAPLVKRSSLFLLLTLVPMVLTRDQVRQGMLEQAGFTLDQAVSPQWVVIAIFAVLLVGAIAVTIWMGSLLLGKTESALRSERTAGPAPLQPQQG